LNKVHGLIRTMQRYKKATLNLLHTTKWNNGRRPAVVTTGDREHKRLTSEISGCVQEEKDTHT